jgi:hypothetical protein
VTPIDPDGSRVRFPTGGVAGHRGGRLQPDTAAGALQPDAVPAPVGEGTPPPGAPAISERHYALAAILAALGEPQGEAASLRTGEASIVPTPALHAAARALLDGEQAARLARLLLPLEMALGAEQLAVRLREHIEGGGAFLEARVRALLEAEAPSFRSLEALPPDVRVLLALVSRRLTASAGGDAPARGNDDDPAAARANETRAGGELGAAVSHVLDRQLRVAHRWLAEGALSLAVPVHWRGEDVQAAVRFRRDGEAAVGEAAGGPAFVVELHVDSQTVGPVHAVVRWRGGSCHSAFYVASDGAAAALDAELGTLRSALAPLFRTLEARVMVDSAVAMGPAPRLTEVLPAGSVLDIRT